MELFLFYVNDLPFSVSDLSKCFMYADDTTLVFKNSVFDCLEINANIAANVLSEWCSKNALQLNINKTKSMHFLTKQNKTSVSPTIVIDEHVIDNVSSFNFLGLWVNENIDWNVHIDIACKKVAKAIFILRRLTFEVDTSTIKTLYYAFVYPHLKYGILLWGSCTDMGRAFVLQKKAIRIMFKLSFNHTCRYSFKAHCILTLPSLYILTIATYVRSHLSNFESADHGYLTRTKINLTLPKASLSIYQRGPVYMATKIYNKIPSFIRNASSIRIFKKSLKDYLIEKCFYNLNEFFTD